MKEINNFFVKGIPKDQQSELITVVITCYNIKAWVGRCIESVRRQTYQNLEILIVDDGSTDGSGEICDQAALTDRRIRVLHEQNGGPGRARNIAIDQAKGDLIAFVDGDDTIEPCMYEAMLSCMLEEGCDMAVCRHFEDHIGETGNQRNSATLPLTTSLALIGKEELMTLYVEENESYPIRNAVWNKLCRRGLLQAIRMPGQMYYEDILFTAKLLNQVEKACFVSLKLYHYVTDRADSIMNQGAGAGILTDQIPSYREKDAFLRSIGRQDLVYTHDYFMYKKLLLLYTEAVRSHDAGKRAVRRDLMAVIGTCRQDFDKIYSCRVADPHQKLRMRMFLISPLLFRCFTGLNDWLILPLRRKIRRSSR